jgi:hypothetical protein
MVAARQQNLPPKVLLDGKHRILDALAAIASGSRLRPGEMAIRFIRSQGGVPEASVLGTDFKTSAINAALANGMFAHADETDDVDPLTKVHPGAGVVPAAMAMAEKEQRSGLELLRAVVLGYDVGCRFVVALGHEAIRKGHRGIECPVSTMGGMAAAASLARFDEEGMRYAIAYGAQQVSGLWSWVEDHDHIEKAFDIGGMGARNGVTAVVMVQNGCTAVRDVLTVDTTRCRRSPPTRVPRRSWPGWAPGSSSPKRGNIVAVRRSPQSCTSSANADNGGFVDPEHFMRATGKFARGVDGDLLPPRCPSPPARGGRRGVIFPAIRSRRGSGPRPATPITEAYSVPRTLPMQS